MKQLIGLILITGLLLVAVFGIISCTTIEAVEDERIPSTATIPQPSFNEPTTSIPVESTEEEPKDPSNESDSSTPTTTEEPSITTYYSITAEERDMLATLCYLEASICSEECQRAVVSVIFNRLESGKWRKDVNKDGQITLYDIVYYPNAFSPSDLIESHKNKTTQECYDAVDYVVANGPTVPTQVRYFRTSYHFKWDGYVGYCNMDNVYFGYLADWQKGAW